MKSQLIRKHPNGGKGRRQEEKGITENEIVGWHHRLNGDEFAQTLPCLDREAWHAVVHVVAKSRTQLSD